MLLSGRSVCFVTFVWPLLVEIHQQRGLARTLDLVPLDLARNDLVWAVQGKGQQVFLHSGTRTYCRNSCRGQIIAVTWCVPAALASLLLVASSSSWLFLVFRQQRLLVFFVSIRSVWLVAVGVVVGFVLRSTVEAASQRSPSFLQKTQFIGSII